VDASPRVEILLLNWNGWRDTLECLASIFALDYPNFGVVVCDNASTDGSVTQILAWASGTIEGEHANPTGKGYLAERSPARPARVVVLDRTSAEEGWRAADDVELVVIRTGGNLGFAGGNNVGLRHILARGSASYVWVLNNDTVASPDALTHLVRHAQRHSSLGAVGATVLDYDEPHNVQYFAGARISPWRGRILLFGRGLDAGAPRPQPEPLHYVSGACMLVPVGVLHDVGLLDDRFFMYSEDADWCFRMRRHGYALGFAPSAVIWHKGGASWTPGNPAQDYHNLLGNLLVMRRYYPTHMPVTLLWAVMRFLAPRIVRGQWRRAAAVLRAFRDFALAKDVSPPLRPAAFEGRTVSLREPLLPTDSP
jgi:GT2 family glycosyltransferase